MENLNFFIIDISEELHCETVHYRLTCDVVMVIVEIAGVAFTVALRHLLYADSIRAKIAIIKITTTSITTALTPIITAAVAVVVPTASVGHGRDWRRKRDLRSITPRSREPRFCANLYSRVRVPAPGVGSALTRNNGRDVGGGK